MADLRLHDKASHGVPADAEAGNKARGEVQPHIRREEGERSAGQDDAQR